MTPKGAWPRSRVLLLKQWDRYPRSTERISCSISCLLKTFSDFQRESWDPKLPTLVTLMVSPIHRKLTYQKIGITVAAYVSGEKVISLQQFEGTV